MTSWYINWYYVCSWCLLPDFRCQALLQIYLKPKIVAAPTRILKAVNHNWDNRTAHIGISIRNLFILLWRGITGTFKRSESKDIFYSIHLILKKNIFLVWIFTSISASTFIPTWLCISSLHLDWPLASHSFIDWRSNIL